MVMFSESAVQEGGYVQRVAGASVDGRFRHSELEIRGQLEA